MIDKGFKLVFSKRSSIGSDLVHYLFKEIILKLSLVYNLDKLIT